MSAPVCRPSERRYAWILFWVIMENGLARVGFFKHFLGERHAGKVVGLEGRKVGIFWQEITIGETSGVTG
jgi:hypothetical protein